MSYIEINDSEIEPEAPILSSIGERWKDNYIEIFSRSSGPRLNSQGFRESLTGSAVWTVPDGIYKVKVSASGGGGGGGRSDFNSTPIGCDGSNGGDTTFGSLTALGGFGGKTISDGQEEYHDKVGSCGGQGGGTAHNGGYGQLLVYILSVTPGDNISYSVGNGGAAAPCSRSGGAPSSGVDGFLVLEF